MSSNEFVFIKAESGMYENEAVIGVSKPGVENVLQGVTRITCKLSNGEVIDSDESSAAITWTDDGVITFDFSKHAFTKAPAGRLNATLDAYDPGHPGGQAITNKEGEENRLSFTFVTSV